MGLLCWNKRRTDSKEIESFQNSIQIRRCAINAICPRYQVICVNGDNEKVKLFAARARISFPIAKTENQATINPIVNQLCPLYNFINRGAGVSNNQCLPKARARPAGQRKTHTIGQDGRVNRHRLCTAVWTCTVPRGRACLWGSWTFLMNLADVDIQDFKSDVLTADECIALQFSKCDTAVISPYKGNMWTNVIHMTFITVTMSGFLLFL